GDANQQRKQREESGPLVAPRRDRPVVAALGDRDEPARVIARPGFEKRVGLRREGKAPRFDRVGCQIQNGVGPNREHGHTRGDERTDDELETSAHSAAVEWLRLWRADATSA